jgi:hypothetical protein
VTYDTPPTCLLAVVVTNGDAETLDVAVRGDRVVDVVTRPAPETALLPDTDVVADVDVEMRPWPVTALTYATFLKPAVLTRPSAPSPLPADAFLTPMDTTAPAPVAADALLACLAPTPVMRPQPVTDESLLANPAPDTRP